MLQPGVPLAPGAPRAHAHRTRCGGSVGGAEIPNEKHEEEPGSAPSSQLACAGWRWIKNSVGHREPLRFGSVGCAAFRFTGYFSAASRKAWQQPAWGVCIQPGAVGLSFFFPCPRSPPRCSPLPMQHHRPWWAGAGAECWVWMIPAMLGGIWARGTPSQG